MACIIDMFWIIVLVFFWEHEFATGIPSVGVVGEEANMTWTISNLTDTVTRHIRNPANNASLIIFFKNQPPYIVDNRTTFRGDLSRGIVAFTLADIRLSDAGTYTFQVQVDANNLTPLGGQALIIAVNPTIPEIIPVSLPAVAGKEYKLNCSTESRSAPTGHNLTMYSLWKKNGLNISMGSGYSVNKTILTIMNLTRNENGDYVTCRAFEDQRRISADSNVSVLNVLYGPENVHVIPSDTMAVGEGENMNLTCLGECNPPCSTFQWQKDSSLTVVESSQSYFIAGVNRNHSGTYICTVTNINISKKATAQITVRVNYGPDADKVVLSPNQVLYEIVESSPIFVNCSANCYPYCQYRWTGPWIGDYGNTGELSIFGIKRDQAGNFTCKATNPEITNKYATASIYVSVFYGPDNGSITLFPNQTSYELNESSSLSVNCSANCYPSCQYRWTSQGGAAYGTTGMLFIPQIKRNHAGIFTCTASNPNITSKSATAVISVIVFYGPDSPLQLLPMNTSYRLVEGETVPNINCTSSCFPSCEFYWNGPVPSLTGVISLGKVNRSVRGNYTCIGRNPKKQTLTSSTVVTVTVIYGPDTPVLTPNTTAYTLNESNILPNIQCSADCFPDCNSSWYKEQTKVPGIKADILSLGGVYRNDSGTYTCKSENMEVRVTKENAVKLVVQYPPTITIESQNGSYGETGLNVICSARGTPEKYIFSLIHSSLFTDIKIQHIIDNQPVSTGVLIHSFLHPSFMDTGVYTCIVSNGILDYRDGSLEKNVSETVWIKGPPNVISSDTEFYAEKGNSGRLVMEFYNSLLDVNVTWNKKSNETLDKLERSNKYNITLTSTMVGVKFYQVLIQQPGFIATLEIKNVTEEDFSSYQVLLQNSIGNLSDLILNLRPRGRPDVPKDVHIVPSSITKRSVNIKWVSGFHGGSDQTFVIEYKTQMEEGWTNYSHGVFGGMKQNKYFNITMEDLYENTLYFFRLYTWNVFGRSDYSTVINASTYAESNKQGITVKGAEHVIIGGAVGAVVLLSIVVAVVGILYRRKRVHRKRGDGTPLELNARSEDINNRESMLQDNPLYATTVAEYAAVVKSKKNAAKVVDSSNLYAQVDKTHANRKRGDVYENIDLKVKSMTVNSEHENSRQKWTETSDGNVYENPGNVASNCPMESKDGLMYADLSLDPPTTKNGKVVIHGIENQTHYAEIAYDKRGQPLPDQEEEMVDDVKK